MLSILRNATTAAMCYAHQPTSLYTFSVYVGLIDEIQQHLRASKTRTVKRQDRDDCPGNRCSCRLSDDHGRLYRLSTCTSSLCPCATLCFRALLERGTRLLRGSGRCGLERRSIYRHDPRPSRRHRIDRKSAHAGRRQRAGSVQQGRCHDSGSSIDETGLTIIRCANGTVIAASMLCAQPKSRQIHQRFPMPVSPPQRLRHFPVLFCDGVPSRAGDVPSIKSAQIRFPWRRHSAPAQPRCRT